MPIGAGQNVEDQLRGLQAVTDAALGRLGVEDFLGGLLDRVREIAKADTVALLLMDDTTHDLVARVARGIEEEVREGVRIPLGVGFAGRIAQEKRPVLLDRVDSTTVANPILWQKGIRTMLGVPLLAGSRVIGVLHVGRLHYHPFGPEDASLLQVVAERLAGAVQRRQLDEERSAANLLERSLLLDKMPDCPGLEFAARYLTPEDRIVGGDWYDLFTLPSGELWIVVGDVAGHGLAAAVVMGRLRSALRSYALLGGPPEKVLELTDRKAQHFEIGKMATIVCATSKPPYREFRVVTAGHPPPVLVVPGEAPSLLELPVGLPLGVRDGVRRSGTTISLPEGALMLFYTDGLVERRHEPLDKGLEQLCGSIRPDHPEVVCRQVLRDLLGSTPPTDDVVVVAVRRLRAPTA
jgi:sigma-B regulation protein RsbU (phosphoserine phosphatase)